VDFFRTAVIAAIASNRQGATALHEESVDDSTFPDLLSRPEFRPGTHFILDNSAFDESSVGRHNKC